MKRNFSQTKKVTMGKRLAALPWNSRGWSFKRMRELGRMHYAWRNLK